jgi:hypothetical protein
MNGIFKFATWHCSTGAEVAISLISVAHGRERSNQHARPGSGASAKESEQRALIPC